MIRLFFTLVFGIFFFADFGCIASAQVPEVKIGVLAKRGSKRCLQEWSPTAHYLADRIPGKCFDIVPISYEEIFSFVENNKVDFILTNSSIYIELESRYGANRIVTIKNRRFDGIYTTYGGSIFWRSDRKDIRDLRDLKNKKFMAVHQNSLGGWLMAWRELKALGIDPYHDFQELRFDTYQDSVVYAVLQGKVDAGTVRTSILEQMVVEKKINLQDFHLVHKQGSGPAALPLPCSTREYPEWPIAKLKHTADELAEKVAIALIQMPSDSSAAIAAGCAGWTIPLNYQSVHECLKELKVGPYKNLDMITFADVFNNPHARQGTTKNETRWSVI
ncbi:MAG: phosphate/phosphite/phosphonate ABC transporter substrate-binding protein [Desulfobacterales bacterium]|nr:phosphate/phosphite/phosphonate ABC transporter substrate-binding protein [Desulfobacterales bacterium]